MAPRTASVAMAVATVAERQDVTRRESMRDFAGVAIGVVLGGLVWIGFLSLSRITS
ncbi:MAG: hypothetical protein FJ027_14310 [Candidatus Rokubacteria bacterium]|nr:hypothetical protein [Candidatus Rokubacteria bacterium]